MKQILDCHQTTCFLAISGHIHRSPALLKPVSKTCMLSDKTTLTESLQVVKIAKPMQLSEVLLSMEYARSRPEARKPQFVLRVLHVELSHRRRTNIRTMEIQAA